MNLVVGVPQGLSLNPFVLYYMLTTLALLFSVGKFCAYSDDTIVIILDIDDDKLSRRGR